MIPKRAGLASLFIALVFLSGCSQDDSRAKEQALSEEKPVLVNEARQSSERANDSDSDDKDVSVESDDDTKTSAEANDKVNEKTDDAAQPKRQRRPRPTTRI